MTDDMMGIPPLLPASLYYQIVGKRLAEYLSCASVASVKGDKLHCNLQQVGKLL